MRQVWSLRTAGALPGKVLTPGEFHRSVRNKSGVLKLYSVAITISRLAGISWREYSRQSVKRRLLYSHPS